MALGKPTSKTFDELVKLVKDHHQPGPSVTVQRYEFNKRIRKDGESFADYVRQLSEYCDFGDSLIEGSHSLWMQRQTPTTPAAGEQTSTESRRNLCYGTCIRGCRTEREGHATSAVCLKRPGALRYEGRREATTSH